MGLLLRAHRAGFLPLRIPEQRLPHHLAPGPHNANLPRNLVLDGALHIPKRIHILDLRALEELPASRRPNGHVRVATQRSLLHIPVGNAKVPHDLANLPHVRIRFAGRAQVRLRNDFDERRSAPVVVQQRVARVLVVNGPPGVLFHVDAGESDALCGRRRLRVLPVPHGDIHMPPGANGRFVLRNLVALRQVGIKIMLARQHGTRRDPALRSQAHAQGIFDHAPIQRGQRAGMPQANRIHMRIRTGPEAGGIRTERLGIGKKPAMRLQANDRFVRNMRHSQCNVRFEK